MGSDPMKFSDEHPCYTCGEVMAFDDMQESDCGNEECAVQHILNWHREREAAARREGMVAMQQAIFNELKSKGFLKASRLALDVGRAAMEDGK